MSKRVLMKGNEALAWGAIRAGCRHFFGYPITPQTEVSAYMAKMMPKAGGTFLQAESEVAAINMVLGASAAGVRAMTSSSSPGISLKAEGISYIAASDLPAVIVNVQRAGPGLGGIQPSQADYWQATKAAGHGDFHLFVLAPSTVQEMADFIQYAFDICDKYRIPAMILTDGMIGQMMEVVYIEEIADKQLPDKKWAASGHRNTRTRNIINSFNVSAQILEDWTNQRYERYQTIIKNEQKVEEYRTEDAEMIMVAYGSTARIVRNAVDSMREQGEKVGMIRPITLWPFPANSIMNHIHNNENLVSLLVVEMSMGQMVEDVKIAVNGEKPVYFYGRTGGMIPSVEEIKSRMFEIIGGEKYAVNF